MGVLGGVLERRWGEGKGERDDGVSVAKDEAMRRCQATARGAWRQKAMEAAGSRSDDDGSLSEVAGY